MAHILYILAKFHLFSLLSLPSLLLFFFLTFYFILGVQPSNNVMIVAGPQQSNSATHDMHPLSSKFPSYPGSLSSTQCHITLSTAPNVYIFLQTRHTGGQEAHEKMFNIANYQRNTNQNSNEISLNTSQNGHHHKTPLLSFTQSLPPTTLPRILFFCLLTLALTLAFQCFSRPWKAVLDTVLDLRAPPQTEVTAQFYISSPFQSVNFSPLKCLQLYSPLLSSRKAKDRLNSTGNVLQAG